MAASKDSAGAVIVLAPKGNDGKRACKALEDAGIRCHVSKTPADVAANLTDATEAILIAEGALTAKNQSVLLKALRRQPPWSDVPVIILTAAGKSDRASLKALDIFG